MRNKAIFSLIILSAILLSACTAKAPVPENQAGDGKDIESEQSQSSSLRDLIALGKNQKCTITTSSTDDDGTKTETTGTIYISGKKMAQEVAVTSTDKEMPSVNMNMISDGQYMYSWNTQSKNQGMKIKMTEPSDGGVQNANGQTGSVDLDNKFDMKCSNWIVDNGKFVIPSDVQFTDLSELMKNIPTVPAGVTLPK